MSALPAFAEKSPNQALILLRNSDPTTVDAVVRGIDDHGGHVGHILPGGSLIAELAPGIDEKIKALPEVSDVIRGNPKVPAKATRAAASAIGIWNHISKSADTLSLPKGQPLTGDALIPPVPSLSASAATINAAAPGSYQTSEFMIGRVAVGVILPESSGNVENWSTARQTQVFGEIVDGLNWWVTRGGTAAHLTFVYDTHYSVPTQYEPITMQGYQDEDVWVSDIFTNLGYVSPDPISAGRSYANELRNTLQTDWAFSIIVVDSLNDSDGKFTSGYFAYAWVGGPYVIMTYDNDGWGISRMNQVASHETGHIFLTADEYCQEGYSCCTAESSGYLNVTNGNCEATNPASVPCIMRNNEDAICQYTVGQIGWTDSDSDGIPDTIDNQVTCNFDSYPLTTQNTVVTLTGVTTDVPCVSPLRTDVTINKITSVQYRVDGGSWTDATAVDGAFNEDTESFTLTTPTLSLGPHTIEAQAVSSSGNTSSIITADIEVSQTINVIYVNQQNQNPVRNGSSWSKAYQTINQAMTAATSGKEIWVASGSYTEHVTLKTGVAMYGGFTGHEGTRVERNPALNTTTIDAGGSGIAVNVQNGATASTIVDGFTITGGGAASGGGVYCFSSSPTIANNVIVENGATGSGGGIYMYNSSGQVLNNVITNNSAGLGGGIYVSGSSPSIRNNTIVYNSATSNGGAAYLATSTVILANNVVAFNSPGVYKSSGSPRARYNCVFSNSTYDYSGMTSSNDIAADPLLSSTDYGLLSGSPCIDHANPSDAPSTDKLGNIRPQDGDADGSVVADIGAFERLIVLGSAKRSLGDGLSITAGGLVVSAVFPSSGQLYVQDPDRTSGIRISTTESFVPGQVVNLSGFITTDTATGERYVIPSLDWPNLASVALPPAPFFVTNQSLGGCTVGYQLGVSNASATGTDGLFTWTPSVGLNSIGLLVRVFGKVIYIDSNGAYFYINDGSGLLDGTFASPPYPIGIRIAGDGRSYSVGDYVALTGISSCMRALDGTVVRLIKPSD